MSIFTSLGVVLVAFQSFVAAPKSLMNIKLDEATRTINVKNQSSGGNVYIITYGDGKEEKSTTAVDYVHTYAQPGIYQVCMITQLITSTSDKPLADTLCETVEIPDISCKANFSITAQGMSIEMIDQSTGNYQKTYWYLGDLKQWVNESKVSYQVSKPGYYNVRLKIEGKYCTSEKDTLVLLRSDPQACIASFSYTLAGTLTYNFHNNSVGQWTHLQWDFGDGSFSNELNPTHVYPHGGNFKVRLTLLDNSRNQISEQVAHIKVEKESLQYFPDFEAITYPDTNLVEFINTSLSTSSSSYIWTFGDGSVSVDSAPSHLYSTIGQYRVCLTQQIKTKRYTTCKEITVGTGNVPLSFNFLILGKRQVVFNPNWAVVPDFVEWNFGDGALSTDVMPIHTYTSDSVYLVILRARWGTQTEEVGQIVNLTSKPEKLNARFFIQMSKNKSTNKRVRYRGSLSGDVSRVRFEWSFGNNTADSLSLDPTTNYSNDSIYTVCLKVFNDLTNDSDRFCQQVRIGETVVKNSTLGSFLTTTQHNGEVSLRCNFLGPDFVRIELFDVAGRKVRNIYTGRVISGEQTFKFKCIRGIYIIRLIGNTYQTSEKLVVY
ncbi:MAG: PKD domain-containing protein [Bacteroidales bacterium]|nr:PKD domain-containing protein [Bacteroidales bacterium]